ncbi:MAG: hypothetical protein Q7W55_07645 [Pseudohongiella sp.]|nr:hypothetical protein [Pseudohongiella sp.]MDO9521376.1 hypothetical protein [Pseudohongiella sp.]MDP2125856.1 hypothetical protein [Pseudohongiella sp.]
MRKIISTLLTTGFLAAALPVQAQTMIEGVYLSPSGENGRGGCTLEIRSLGKSPKYGDELYALISSGEGACEWTAVGLAKNFAITAGMVSSGGHSGFVNAKWPFGPGGGRVEIASFDADGTTRNSLTFSKADSK